MPDSRESLCTGDCDVASYPVASLLLQLQNWFGQGWLGVPRAEHPCLGMLCQPALDLHKDQV